MDSSVIIIGAGPVGLMLANLLGKADISTIVIERKAEADKYSKAIGVMPPSLQIFKQIGLEQTLIEAGLKVTTAVVHGKKLITGRLDFTRIKGDYPYILTIPQSDTERILEARLKALPSVKLMREVEFLKVTENGPHVEISLRALKDNREFSLTAAYLCACDGGKSEVREAVGVKSLGARYRQTFLMGDFRDNSGLGNEAHLFFTPDGAVESFPLPGNVRRWVVETDRFMTESTIEDISRRVAGRAGFKIEDRDQLSQSPFGVQHYINSSYYKNRVIFCGDSAHTMSPIGGQGMNTGFADAELLSTIIERLLQDDSRREALCKRYEYYRKKAAMSAIKRAAFGMGVGTVRGGVGSALRNGLIYLIFHTPLIHLIPPHFSMLTIPYGTFEKVTRRDPLFQPG